MGSAKWVHAILVLQVNVVNLRSVVATVAFVSSHDRGNSLCCDSLQSDCLHYCRIIRWDLCAYLLKATESHSCFKLMVRPTCISCRQILWSCVLSSWLWANKELHQLVHVNLLNAKYYMLAFWGFNPFHLWCGMWTIWNAPLHLSNSLHHLSGIL